MAIIGHAWGGRLVSLILGTIFAVIGFFFIAWCLAVIGDAQGYRKVFGFSVVSTMLAIDLALLDAVELFFMKTQARLIIFRGDFISTYSWPCLL